MKLRDANLCPDCDEVYSYKEQIHPYNHYPICPDCGNKYSLNLGRVLNRKEANNETSTDGSVGSNSRDPIPTSIDKSKSGISNTKEEQFFTDVGNQERVRESGGEGAGCYIPCQQTDGVIRVLSTVFDVLGKLVRLQSDIGKELSRFNANPPKQAPCSSGGGCEHSDRGKDISRKAEDHKRGLQESFNSLQGLDSAGL